MELHDEPVLDAHPGELDQHVAGEAAGFFEGRLTAKSMVEDHVGLGLVE